MKLEGIRVVDLSLFLPGPAMTQMMADHGAEVIKVEPPQGDEVRDWGPPFRDGTASYYDGVNRNKRAMALDLARPAARQILMRLLETADVLIHNFKRGALEKWGLGPEELHAVNPRLVIVRVSGFGQDGPYADKPGFASVGEAMGGIRYINGFPDMPPPRAGISLVG